MLKYILATMIGILLYKLILLVAIALLTVLSTQLSKYVSQEDLQQIEKYQGKIRKVLNKLGIEK